MVVNEQRFVPAQREFVEQPQSSAAAAQDYHLFINGRHKEKGAGIILRASATVLGLITGAG